LTENRLHRIDRDFTREAAHPIATQSLTDEQKYLQDFEIYGKQTSRIHPHTPLKMRIQNYKMRAEFRSDVEEWLKTAGHHVTSVVFIPSTVKLFDGSVLPEVGVTFSSPLSLADLRKTLKKVVDGHVMLESLNTADAYTGDRYYCPY